ncbi:hypothetical protein Y032_0080g1358 [Ancylostoma ceylanicum]|uniref:Protein-tyrosine phosphatase n=1 Tax=Ancylostoma ceylanicum TaxID=53326 RepID=A0A016TTR0_9BILA|nr:hypothetical protein Y032_0080g1358 [Ancylostoma ceylanicum]
MYVRKRVSRGTTPKRQVDRAAAPVCSVRRRQTYGPPRTRSNEKGKDAIPLNIEEIVKDYVERAVSMGVQGVVKEFKSVCSYRAPDNLYKYESFSKNRARNRYEDVVCLESTRVRLTQDVPPSTDYIHANWVKFEGHDRQFIATQTVETDKMKCILYWPQHAGSFNTYDKMFVNTKKIEYEEQCAIYTIELLPEGCSDSHIVKLIHMTNWPDKGVPASGRHVLRLLRMVVANKLDCGPIVVHCSAGVGRTGSIILIDIILRKLFSGERVEMVKLFKQLRDQRAHAINMPSLYVFVVYSVLDYIRSIPRLRHHRRRSPQVKEETPDESFVWQRSMAIHMAIDM